MKKPKIHEEALVLSGAVVVGEVTLEKDVSVWYHAAIRGDLAPIEIGEGSNVQEGAVIHVDHDFPVLVGKQVTVGHGAILHGCEIGDCVLIGMGAIILNGAKIGKNSIIGAGALVTQNTVIPENSLVLGSPAKVKRSVTSEEIEASLHNAKEYRDLIPTYKK